MHIETLERRQLFAFGDFDPTFGTGGRAVIPFERGDTDFQRGARDVLVLADGRIATISEKELALYKPNGTLDASFGGGSGFVKIDFGGRLAQAGDGDLLVHSGLRVHSFRLDGSVDSSFGQNGVFSYSPGAFIDSPMEFELDAQGRIYIFADEWEGVDSPTLSTTPYVLRLTPGGTLDPSFGSGGVVRPELSDTADLPPAANLFAASEIASITIDGDGRIVLAGQTDHYSVVVNPNDNDPFNERKYVRSFPFIARLTSNGAMDTTFDGDGVWHDPTGYEHFDLSPNVLTLANGDALAAIEVMQRTTFIDIPDSGSIAPTLRLRQTGEQDLINPDDVQQLPDGRLLLIALYTLAWAKRLPGGGWEVGPAISKVPFDSVLGNTGDTTLTGAAFEDVDVQPDGAIVTSGHGFLDGGDEVKSNDDRVYQLARLLPGNPNDLRPDVLPDGTGNSVAEHTDATLHVAYHDSASNNLKYRRRDYSGRWGAIETIDAGPATGEDPSLALDSKGNVAVAYFDGISADLKLARRGADGTWTIATVDSRGGTGLYPDLKFDHADGPWIAYYNKTRGDLRLASFINNAWRIETVDAIGDVGRTPSLVENQNTGRWSIAYTAADRTLRLAERQKNRKFAITTVAQTAGGAYWPVLSYEDDGGFDGITPNTAETVIAYYDANAGDLVVSRRPFGSSTFSSKRLATRGATGLYPQISKFLVFQYPSYIWWWDRTHNTVAFGTDRLSRNEKIPFKTRPEAIIGGGRYLSVSVRDNWPGNLTLVYLDEASGDLFVRPG